MSCCGLAARVEQQKMATYYFAGLIPLQVLRAPIPCRRYSRLAETKYCVLANKIQRPPEGGVAGMSSRPARTEVVGGRPRMAGCPLIPPNVL